MTCDKIFGFPSFLDLNLSLDKMYVDCIDRVKNVFEHHSYKQDVVLHAELYILS